MAAHLCYDFLTQKVNTLFSFPRKATCVLPGKRIKHEVFKKNTLRALMREIERGKTRSGAERVESAVR